MQPAFFQFMMKFVNDRANDPMSRLANAIHHDTTFPKHTADFDEISNYMEHTSIYSKMMPIFDEAWSKYQYEN